MTNKNNLDATNGIEGYGDHDETSAKDRNITSNHDTNGPESLQTQNGNSNTKNPHNHGGSDDQDDINDEELDIEELKQNNDK